jgi:magnesium transporter
MEGFAMATCYASGKQSGLRTDLDLGVALECVRGQQDVVWINMEGPTAEELNAMGYILNLHEVTVEDLKSPKVRPKVEEFENYLLVVFKAMNFNEGEDPLDVINLNLLLFKNALITVHLKPLLSIPEVQQSVRRKPPMMQKGAAFIMYCILDRIVGRYFPLMSNWMRRPIRFR